LIRNIRADGVTIVMVEHVMQAIMALSDSIVVLHHGEKLFEGHPRQVATNPAVVQAYLGEEAAALRTARANTATKRRNTYFQTMKTNKAPLGYDDILSAEGRLSTASCRPI
jgi:ABC-type sugar transport system ATPase subunit